MNLERGMLNRDSLKILTGSTGSRAFPTIDLNQAITQADILRVAKQYLHPDQLIILAAGDRSKIETPLTDAGVGPVEVRDINGKLATDTAK